MLRTPEQAAEVLSISRAKLYQLLKTGEIESIKISRSRRIPDDAITSYVNRLRADQVRGAAA